MTEAEAQALKIFDDYTAGVRALLDSGLYDALPAAERQAQLRWLLDTLDTIVRSNVALRAAYTEAERVAEDLLAMARRQAGTEPPVH
jgi:hypothetical protein